MALARKNSISRDIRFLGDLLGEVIQEVSGPTVFQMEEKLRKLAKEARAGKPAARRQLKKSIASLSPQEAYEVALAFTTYFELVNIAEENYRLSLILKKRQSKSGLKESLDQAFLKLKKAGRKVASEVLQSLQLELVLTAHPTEVKRRSILSKIHRIGQLFDQAGEELPSPQLVKREIASLWMTSRTRLRKPEVRHEVDMGLWYFENSLFESVLKLTRRLEGLTQKHFPQSSQNPKWIQFGSWIGGDRDGHPEVTPEVTEETLLTHRSRSLSWVGTHLETLADRLSFSGYRDEFSGPLLDQLEAWETDSKLKFILESHRSEPYRAYLLCLRAQLTQLTEKELLLHLEQVEGSLAGSRARSVFSDTMSDLKSYLHIFGLHTARLDLRQESSEHESAIEEVLRAMGLGDSYVGLAEAEKLEILERLSRESLAAETLMEAGDEKFRSVFKPLLKMQAAEEGARGLYVISMTEAASDVLEVLVLMKWAGVKMPIVPLFETAKDLRQAPVVLRQLFQVNWYLDHHKELRHPQTVMLGYSDSNKDCGYATANWLIFSSQKEIQAVCDAHEIELVLFHGRGGSVARGGGPAARAILSQPVGLKSGKIRITEQGEVLSSRYQRKGIAERILEQMAYGVLLGTWQARTASRVDENFRERMEEISEAAEDKYRKLVKESPGFIEYWNQITPIEFIKGLKIGSRPASRKPTLKVEDLRAIPWVFSWVQIRSLLPGWYGLGTGLSAVPLADLKKMYKAWGFFRALIDNAQLSLKRADLPVAELYHELSDHPEAKAFWVDIRSEYEATEKMILKLTGQRKLLDNEPTLQKSIQLRNPYVDPLNFIQQEMIKRFRQTSSEDERKELLRVIELSLSGISSALRSTG